MSIFGLVKCFNKWIIHLFILNLIELSILISDYPPGSVPGEDKSNNLIGSAKGLESTQYLY